MTTVAINPFGNFEKAHEWAKNYNSCDSCEFLGVLCLGPKKVPMLIFRTNYPYEDVIEYISDITSIDGNYHKLIN